MSHYAFHSCRQCGNRLPESAAFCPACGSAVTSARPELATGERLPTLRPKLYSRPGRPDAALEFVEFNVAYETEGNAIAVGLGAGETEDCLCGCHTFVTPIVRAWWCSKN